MSHLPRALMARVASGAGGVAAPVITGSPTLVGSWDFGNAAKLSLTGSVINSIAGSDGTSVTLTSTGSPTSALTGGTLAALLNGSTQYFQVTNDLGITTSVGAATLVCIATPTSVAGNSAFLEVGTSASDSSSSRVNILGIGAAVQCRSGDATTSANSGGSPTALTTARHLLIGRAPSGHTGAPEINVDGEGTATVGGSALSGTSPTMTTTSIGVRWASGGGDLFASAYILRCLIYNSFLSNARVEQIAVWSASNYGTSNLA